ncbi:MAG: hypothetical protein WA941_07775, partial [Nitrososphaeraceae archaeon]
TGQKRCQICEIFIDWEGLWCPCCGYRLRAKPRNLRYKSKMREQKLETDLKRQQSGSSQTVHRGIISQGQS